MCGLYQIQNRIKMDSVSSKKLRSDIADILKDADLTKLSSKKIRLQLEEKYDNDLSDRKSEIDKIVMEEIQLSQEKRSNIKPDPSTTSSNSASTSKGKSANGRKIKEESKVKKEESDMEEDQGSEPDEKGSEKDSDAGSDNDEDIARKLQEEEENNAGRRTRGGRSNNADKKKPREKKERKKGVPRLNKYMEPCLLSPQLAAIMGEDRLKRCDVVKKMWAIVKERNLYDPRNKQFMICDTEMQKVFGKKRVRIFGMMKHLTNHIYKSDEVIST